MLREHTRLGIISLILGGIAIIAGVTIFILLAVWAQGFFEYDGWFLNLISRHERVFFSLFFVGIISGLAASITGGKSFKDSFGRFGLFLGILGLFVAGVFLFLLIFAVLSAGD